MSVRIRLVTAGLVVISMMFLGGAPRTSAVGTRRSLPHSAQSKQGSPVTGSPRVTTFHHSWEASCDNHSCTLPLFAAVTVTTPTTVRKVDVILNATFNFRTSHEDQGTLSVVYRLDGESQLKAMAPGPFEFVSPSPLLLTTSSASWIRQGLAAGGLTYTFFLSASVRDADADGGATFSGLQGTVVIAMGPAAS